jgi:phage tail sheath protein FI
MATQFKTPGVYIQEIPTLGSSIAGVPTAIPGFVGYTEKAIINGTAWTYPTGAPAPPVRITSLLEFMQIFGGPFNETFDVTLSGTVPSPTTIQVTPTSVTSPNNFSDYILFYQVQMFYANGGGACWVVSADKYPTSATAISKTKLEAGINSLEKVDEVTILCTPEAVFIDSPSGDREELYNLMAAQCAKLQSRFAVLDVVHNGTNTISQDASDFRNNDIGPDNLKYAGAYYPALNTTIAYNYQDSDVTIIDNRTLGSGPFNYKYGTPPNDKLPSVLNGNVAIRDIQITQTAVFSDKITITIPSQVAQLIDPTVPTTPTDAFGNVANIVNNINTNSVLSLFVVATNTSTNITPSFRITAKAVGAVGNTYAFTTPLTSPYSPLSGNLQEGVGAEIATYNQITAALNTYRLSLYPSAAMAGIYALVDASRGVWKAPANVGVALVSSPAIQITDAEQEDLNVDSVSGKSINAIRRFTGRGILVWGARTLAGNDNEWRYINVRRLFTYVEISSRNATEFVVFEPNTANTWNRVKSMIETFLTGLWRDGALAGATTKDAFFVNVGLGTTMTADDILNGRMIVEIGMAAARPAEFIILKFEHKLQES